MKKGIVGLILGAFFIALFAPPAFASPGPPNPNAPSQNIKDIKPTTNEAGWENPLQRPRVPNTKILLSSYGCHELFSIDYRLGILWEMIGTPLRTGNAVTHRIGNESTPGASGSGCGN
jgi:hypothetical protein